MTRSSGLFLILVCGLFLFTDLNVYGFTPVPVQDDPLVRMPGTQRPPENTVDLEGPGRCMNCHAGYDTAVEPGFNWQGSMMAQAGRDFLYFACLTVSAQDSIWAVGNPNATDICLRCHFPEGWVEGRSDPTNASLMTGSDWDGIHCDACHRQYDPFFESTYEGTREGDQWESYWDETDLSATPSSTAADAARAIDINESNTVKFFNESDFFGADNKPVSAGYLENGAGQFFLANENDKRASFADATARHNMQYSRYHKSKFYCSSCHDVSNPVLANLGSEPAQPLPTELNSAFSYFHVERTFSEFMLSDYGLQGGAPGVGPFDPAVFNTSKTNNYIAMCQDCHMRDSTGVGSNKSDSILRPDGSIEHPNSGQPIHDLTGGNVWVSSILASTVSGSSNFDQTNHDLLSSPATLTLDLTAGEGINSVALLAGADRAMQQLQLAARITDAEYEVGDNGQGDLSFYIQNQTGHKLISGFPEGRRMFVNIKFYSKASPDRTLLLEVNPYDYTAGTLKGLDAIYTTLPGELPLPAVLAPNEVYVDELVYEMKPTSDLTGEDKTFHFALATGRYKDNRIPPRGFRIAEAADRLCQPRWDNADRPDYFTAEEYAGGYDEIYLSDFGVDIPNDSDVDLVEIQLYYQTTSREYIEFLRDEINGTATSLTSPGAGGDPAYLVQTDPFFTGLTGWGDTIWQIWLHNMDAPGAAPVLMTAATTSPAASECDATVPLLISVAPLTEELQITWSDESKENSVLGYELFYDQAGKSQLVATVADPQTITYLDSDLLGGVPHCYKVRSYAADCASEFSTIQCETPYMRGDLNRDMDINLTDVIYGLQIGSHQTTDQQVYSTADVNEDGKLGVPESVHALKVVSGEL